jgi:hypothetical protein
MRAVSLIFRISAMFAMSTLVAAFPSFSSAFSVTSQPRTAVEPETKTIIWQDPGAVEELDFVAGPGGVKKVPTPPFTFVEETLSGSNPKVKVKDANDTTWHVKWGSEVNAEVFATRMAWAAGYFVDPSYFIASGKIEGAKGLKRAKKFVNSDGSFTNARFERHKNKGATVLDDEKSWRWDQNPLVGTPELNGLKIMLMLTSNWDNKDVRDISRGSNTAILEYQDGESIERRYMVTDWGGSMGKWGGVMGREKWDAKGYEKQTPDFIKGVERGFVEFGYSGQHTGTFKEGISVNDVKWLVGYVGRITDQQIRDGLKASGATPDEVDVFTRAIRNRIDQMRKLT